MGADLRGVLGAINLKKKMKRETRTERELKGNVDNFYKPSTEKDCAFFYRRKPIAVSIGASIYLSCLSILFTYKRRKSRRNGSGSSLLPSLVILASLLLIWSLMEGCQVEDFANAQAVSYQAKWGVPVGNTSYLARDVIENNISGKFIVDQDSNQLLLTHYSWNKQVNLHKKLAFVAAQRMKYSFTQSTDLAAPSDHSSVSTTSEEVEFNFRLDSASRVDSIVYKAAQLRIEKRSSFPSRAESRITFLQLKVPGSRLPFRAVLEANYQGQLPITLQQTYNLENHLMSFDDGQKKMSTWFELELSQQANEALQKGNTMSYDLVFSEATLRSFYGLLDTRSISVGQQKFPITGLERLTGPSDVVFIDPRLILSFSNYYGIPLKIFLKSIAFMNSENERSELSATGLGEGFFMDPAEKPGAYTHKEVVFHTGNSNLSEIFRKVHSGLFFDVDVVINPPLPSPQASQNFSIEGQSLDIGVTIKLPYSVIIKNRQEVYKFPNTYANELSTRKKKIPDIKQATLRLVIDNSLPLKGTARLIFQQKEGTLQEIGETLPIDMPMMRNQKVMQTNRQVYDIEVAKDDYDKLISSANVLVETVLESEKDEKGKHIITKLYAGHELRIQLVVLTEIEEEITL